MHYPSCANLNWKIESLVKGVLHSVLSLSAGCGEAAILLPTVAPRIVCLAVLWSKAISTAHHIGSPENKT